MVLYIGGRLLKHFKFHYNMTLESTSGTGALKTAITLVVISNFGGFSESYDLFKSKIW